MNNLTTRKIVFGLFMTCVLAFGMQGNLAEALTFTRPSNSGDLQTVRISAPDNGQFTISASITLRGDTPRYNAAGKLIDTTGVRIDSSGYKVRDVGTTEYRISAAAVQLPRATHYYLDATSTYRTIDASNVVDSSRYVYNIQGTTAHAVYTRSGTSPNFTYQRAQADPDDPVTTTRYYYNEEGITIGIAAGLTLVRVNSYPVSVTGGNHLMTESRTTLDALKLTSGTLQLTFSARAPGTYNITITDATPNTDMPPPAPATPLMLPFTVYVVERTGSVGGKSTALDGTDGVEYGYQGEDSPLNEGANPDTIGLFDFGERGDNDLPVYYSVEGGGRVYVDGPGTRQTTPSNTLFTSSNAPVSLQTNNSTNKVTAYVAGNPGSGKKAIFIFSRDNRSPNIEITGGDGQVGVTGGRLEDPLEVKVTDANGRPLSGVAVKFTSVSTSSFIPFPGTRVYGTAMLSSTVNPGLVALVDNTNTAETTVATATRPAHGGTIFVQTDSSGVAKTYYQLSSTAGTSTVTAVLEETALRLSVNFSQTGTTDTRTASLVKVSGDSQRAERSQLLTNPLVVRARSTGGYRIANVVLQFSTITGTLIRDAASGPGSGTGPGQVPPDTPNIDVTSGQRILVVTDSNGEARVRYNVGQLVEARNVTVQIFRNVGRNPYEFIVSQVVFDVNGTTSQTPDPNQPSTPAAATLSVSPLTISGAPGSTQALSITTPAGQQASLSGQLLTAAGGAATRVNGTGTFTSDLTLPTTVGSYTLDVTAGTDTRRVTVTVATPRVTGTLSLNVAPSGAPGSTSTATVTATDSGGNPISGVSVSLSVSSNAGSFSPASVTTGGNGTAISILTRGSASGVVTAAADGWTSVELPIVVTGAGQTAQTPTPQPASGEAALLNAYEGNNQAGALDSPLANPLVVEVLDTSENAVSNAQVRFRTTIGSGRFSPRTARTDADGFAETTFTPTSTGSIRIVATVSGVGRSAVFFVDGGAAADALVKISGDNQRGTPSSALDSPFVVEVQDEDGDALSGVRVTFSVTAGGGRLSATNVTTGENGRAETVLTLGSGRAVNSVRASVSGVDPITFNTSIEPNVLVAAGSRPMMYWIDAAGTLHRLVGADVENIAPGVDNATSLAMSGNKLYWTAGDTSAGPRGSLNSANLDGTGVTKLGSDIYGVPLSIAVDTVGGKLYWTDPLNRIQRSNLDGTGVGNLVRGATNPGDLLVANGMVYWTEAAGRIRSVNISGTKSVKVVVSGLGEPLSIAIGGTKLYWLERAADGSGKLQRANLDGSNTESLKTFTRLYDTSLAVDATGRKIYLTGSGGKISRRNLNGVGYQEVVTSLMSPGSIVLGGATTAVAPATTTTTTPPKTAAGKSQYDVNGDGKVDNTDASLVAAAMGTDEAKYDVNGDGTVNFLDLLLIFDNRAEGAAAAPTVVGLKLTGVQIAGIEEQIEALIATGDRSPAAMRTLIYLQQLLATARPEKTQLLANYPNPFNPETWIPYELATDTDVRITIYSAQGVVIRTLQLGHQSAGYYTDRERAAFWDGRNAFGEQVASGVYFYQLETDTVSTMRKMVILK